jgi:hypothetical protein
LLAAAQVETVVFVVFIGVVEAAAEKFRIYFFPLPQEQVIRSPSAAAVQLPVDVIQVRRVLH